jgi:hypothetical protein
MTPATLRSRRGCCEREPVAVDLVTHSFTSYRTDVECRRGEFNPKYMGPVVRHISVDSPTGTICWPNGVDLDPDVLHGDADPASGPSYEVLAEHHLRRTG